MYPERASKKRTKKSVSFEATELLSQNVETNMFSSQAKSKEIVDDNNDEDDTNKKAKDDDAFSFEVYDELKKAWVDSPPNQENKKEGKDESTLETPVLTHKRLKRRSLLMRMVDEEANFLPSRRSMLKSVRVANDENFSDDDEEEEPRKFEYALEENMEQSADLQKMQNEKKVFGFKKMKQLPDIIVSPNKTKNRIRGSLTENELRKLQMTEDDLIQQALSKRNFMRYILGWIFLLIGTLLFAFITVGIGYKLGQKYGA